MLKIIPFNISKHYIFFNTPLYNIPNIKHLICFSTSLKYYFLYYFLIFFYCQCISFSFFLPLSFSMYIFSPKQKHPTYHSRPLPATTIIRKPKPLQKRNLALQNRNLLPTTPTTRHHNPHLLPQPHCPQPQTSNPNHQNHKQVTNPKSNHKKILNPKPNHKPKIKSQTSHKL